MCSDDRRFTSDAKSKLLILVFIFSNTCISAVIKSTKYLTLKEAIILILFTSSILINSEGCAIKLLIRDA